jgi:stearoyl-CoA desaturase (Delta-9 desaturase)
MLEVSPLPVADPVAELPLRNEPSGKASLSVRVVNLIAIVVPLCGLVAAPVFLWGWGFHWIDLVLLVSMYVLTAFGITVGFHRLFTHRSFETNIVVKVIFAILGSMALQGPMLKWVAMHRRHHQFSDTTNDPHSPHHHGHGIWGLLRGAWHAHIGWLFDAEPENLMAYVPDLHKNRTLRITSNLFLLWVMLGLAIPAVLGGLLTWSWRGALTGLIWGGLIRIFLVHHVTWSVNSACHLWGSRPFRSADESRNNAIFGVLAMGEGWHATHHAFPTSARHGLRWWQIDLSYWLIRGLKFVGLAWDVRLPTRESVRERKMSSPRQTAG